MCQRPGEAARGDAASRGPVRTPITASRRRAREAKERQAAALVGLHASAKACRLREHAMTGATHTRQEGAVQDETAGGPRQVRPACTRHRGRSPGAVTLRCAQQPRGLEALARSCVRSPSINDRLRRSGASVACTSPPRPRLEARQAANLRSAASPADAKSADLRATGTPPALRLLSACASCGALCGAVARPLREYLSELSQQPTMRRSRCCWSR